MAARFATVDHDTQLIRPPHLPGSQKLTLRISRLGRSITPRLMPFHQDAVGRVAHLRASQQRMSSEADSGPPVEADAGAAGAS